MELRSYDLQDVSDDVTTLIAETLQEITLRGGVAVARRVADSIAWAAKAENFSECEDLASELQATLDDLRDVQLQLVGMLTRHPNGADAALLVAVALRNHYSAGAWHYGHALPFSLLRTTWQDLKGHLGLTRPPGNIDEKLAMVLQDMLGVEPDLARLAVGGSASLDMAAEFCQAVTPQAAA